MDFTIWTSYFLLHPEFPLKGGVVFGRPEILGQERLPDGKKAGNQTSPQGVGPQAPIHEADKTKSSLGGPAERQADNRLPVAPGGLPGEGA